MTFSYALVVQRLTVGEEKIDSIYLFYSQLWLVTQLWPIYPTGPSAAQTATYIRVLVSTNVQMGTPLDVVNSTPEYVMPMECGPVQSLPAKVSALILSLQKQWNSNSAACLDSRQYCIHHLKHMQRNKNSEMGYYLNFLCWKKKKLGSAVFSHTGKEQESMKTWKEFIMNLEMKRGINWN